MMDKEEKKEGDIRKEDRKEIKLDVN